MRNALFFSFTLLFCSMWREKIACFLVYSLFLCRLHNERDVMSSLIVAAAYVVVGVVRAVAAVFSVHLLTTFVGGEKTKTPNTEEKTTRKKMFNVVVSTRSSPKFAGHLQHKYFLSFFFVTKLYKTIHTFCLRYNTMKCSVYVFLRSIQFDSRLGRNMQQ